MPGVWEQMLGEGELEKKNLLGKVPIPPNCGVYPHLLPAHKPDLGGPGATLCMVLWGLGASQESAVVELVKPVRAPCGRPVKPISGRVKPVQCKLVVC